MKQLLIFVVCLVGLSGTRLLGQDLVWVKQLPGVGSDYNLAIIMDNAGNSISTGTFGGTVDFYGQTIEWFSRRLWWLREN